jgi:hypothetical protein
MINNNKKPLLEMCEGSETETYLHIRTGNAPFAIRPMDIEDIKQNYIRKDKLPSVKNIQEIIDSRLDCQACDNSGMIMPDGEQCQFCYEEENSKYNLAKAIVKSIKEQ